MDEPWIRNLKKLATDNANLRVVVRTLRLEVTHLKSEVDHYRQEFARQNAQLLELGIRMEVENGP